MRLKGERSFHRSELIFEPRRLEALAQLHYSTSEYVRLSTESLPALVVDGSIPPHASISRELAKQFDALADSFKKLSQTCIFVLRIELRCHSLYYLDLAIREACAV
nr:hypothetical protein HK105_000715 [Polyrhizophydium stewartii]